MGRDEKHWSPSTNKSKDSQFVDSPCQLPNAATSTIAWEAFDFMVSLKNPCCAPKSQLERIAWNTKANLAFVWTPYVDSLP